MTEKMLIESFHAMWDHMPVKARLIRADRTVLAVNREGERQGSCCGVRCCDEGEASQHIGCMAAEALKTGEARWGWNPAGTKLRFWLPVSGAENCYVHFSLTKDQVNK